METNYYLHQKPACKECGRDYEPKHIGKSSGGWAFALHVIPEDGINSLDDWRRLWNEPGAVIKDEYGCAVSPAVLEDCITNRSHPRGLQRAEDRHCVGRGDGPWDLVTGWFS